MKKRWFIGTGATIATLIVGVVIFSDNVQGGLKEEWDTYTEAKATLSPEDNAKQWAQLVFRHFDQEQSVFRRSGKAVSIKQLMGGMPGPEGWATVRKLIDARKKAEGDKPKLNTLLLDMMWLRLEGNIDGLRGEYLTLQAQVQGNASAEEALRYNIGRLENALLPLTDDPKFIETILHQRMDTLSQPGRDRSHQEFNCPDVVTLLGEDKARAILRKALVIPVRLRINTGERTKSIAREELNILFDDVPKARWGLLQSIEHSALFERMKKKWGKGDGGSSWEYRDAQGYYILSLIVDGKTEKAATLVSESIKTDEYFSLPWRGLEHIHKHGHGTKVYSFVHDFMKQTPAPALWSTFTNLAAETGNEKDPIAIAKGWLTQEVDPELKVKAETCLIEAYLSADEVEPAVALILASLEKNPKPSGDSLYEIKSLAIRLATLGHLLEKPEWVTRGEDASKVLMTLKAEEGDGYDSPDYEALLTYAMAYKRWDILKAIGDLSDKAVKQNDVSTGYGSMGDRFKAKLCHLYATKQYKAIVTLIKTDKRWGTVDLMGQVEKDLVEDLPLAYVLALALAKTDQKEQALAILNYGLEGKLSGYDPAYELYLSVQTNPIKRLETLAELNIYEERPLIWQAKWHLNQGNLKEAEAKIQQAIATDPSDGEQGPGLRMTAYAVLGAIRKAQGNQEQVKLFDGVIKAIRSSEHADKVHQVGLHTRAIKLYKAALNHFADAYCIQSRLALRMSNLGLHEQAMIHYRRAFELMPDSFGRVESHCFGCEGVFGSSEAKSIAEEVFSKFIKTRPNKPQVHYLMGYLKSSQKKYKEAAGYFSKAVELDPKYLNAWKKLVEVMEKAALPAQKREDIAVAFLRLNPRGYEAKRAMKHIRDLRVLWDVLSLPGGAKRMTKPKSLLVFEAIKAAQAAQGKSRDRVHHMLSDNYFPGRSGSRAINPVLAIQSEPVISELHRMLRDIRHINGASLPVKAVPMLRTFHSNGRKATEATLHRGKIEGQEIFYDDKGTIQAKLNYKGGRYHGKSQWFYPDGKLRGEIEYQNGRRHGISKTYDINGSLTKNETYKEGVLITAP